MEPDSKPTSTEILAQWVEPARPKLPGLGRFTSQTILLSILVAIAMAGLGYFQKDFTFYMAAVASIVVGLFLISQRRRQHEPFEVVLTNSLLVVGRREYPLTTLAGFWFSDDLGQLLINVEPKKPAAFPIAFLYPNNNQEEARQVLLQVLGEVESRHKTLTDTISQYIRL